MNAEVASAWGRVQAMIDGFIASLPSIILSIIVFAIFYLLDFVQMVREFPMKVQ